MLDRHLLARLAEKIPFCILAAICAWLTVIAQDGGGALNSIGEAVRSAPYNQAVRQNLERIQGRLSQSSVAP